MFMSNIPRRRIYEKMLEFEDGMIDMQILIFSNSNFKKYEKKFNKESFSDLKQSYIDIKALLILFAENKKFKDDGSLEKYLDKIKGDDELMVKEINSCKAFTNKFKKQLFKIDKTILEEDYIDSFEQAKEFYDLLDEFNDEIPRILTIRRDQMKLS